MTQAMSGDGIRPRENLSDERGQAKQGICGLDEDGIDYDDDDDMEESEKCGDSSESEVEEAENVKSHEEDTKVIEESEEPTIGEEAPVRTTRNPADPTSEERERHDATHLPQGLVPCVRCCQSNGGPALPRNCGREGRGQAADMR